MFLLKDINLPKNDVVYRKCITNITYKLIMKKIAILTSVLLVLPLSADELVAKETVDSNLIVLTNDNNNIENGDGIDKDDSIRRRRRDRRKPRRIDSHSVELFSNLDFLEAKTIENGDGIDKDDSIRRRRRDRRRKRIRETTR